MHKISGLAWERHFFIFVRDLVDVAIELLYHIVLLQKYRRRVLNGAIADKMKFKNRKVTTFNPYECFTGFKITLQIRSFHFELIIEIITLQ